ncbi:unnamed protein product, partial [Menidia menidia]
EKKNRVQESHGAVRLLEAVGLVLQPISSGYGTLHVRAMGKNDSLLISVAGMAVYTGYIFMPQHIMAILNYFEVLQ